MGRADDLPGMFGSSERVRPLSETTLFPRMNFLSFADEPDKYSRLRNAICNVDEELRLRGVHVLLVHHVLRIPRALRLVENKHVLRGNAIGVPVARNELVEVA